MRTRRLCRLAGIILQSLWISLLLQVIFFEPVRAVDPLASTIESQMDGPHTRALENLLQGSWLDKVTKAFDIDRGIGRKSRKARTGPTKPDENTWALDEATQTRNVVVIRLRDDIEVARDFLRRLESKRSKLKELKVRKLVEIRQRLNLSLQELQSRLKGLCQSDKGAVNSPDIVWMISEYAKFAGEVEAAGKAVEKETGITGYAEIDGGTGFVVEQYLRRDDL